MTTPAPVFHRPATVVLRPRFGNSVPESDTPRPIIRKATSEDAAKAFPLWLDAFQAGSTAGHVQKIAEKAVTREAAENVFKEEFWVDVKKPTPRRLAFVMEGEEPSKFLGLGVLETVKSFQGVSRPMAKNAVIWAVAVDKDHQRKGYGTHMVSHLTQAAKEQNVATVMTLASSKNKSFYEKQGFTARHIPLITPVTEWLLEHLIGYRHALVKNLKPLKERTSSNQSVPEVSAHAPAVPQKETLGDTVAVVDDVKEAS